MSREKQNDYVSRPKMLSELRGGFFPQDVVYTEAVAIAKQIIESAPAEEDVVKVVRCKDCKYFRDDYRYCVLLGVDYFGDSKVGENDFCSYGERREQK